jgi:membrane associated rhomboid family serine protease
MLFPNSEIRLLFFPVPIKAKYFVLLYGLYELTQVPAVDGVAHTAHLGGLLVGFIIIKYWQKSRTNFY